MSIITRLDHPDLSHYTWIFEDISRKRAAKASRRSQAEKQASPPAQEGAKNAEVAQSKGGVSSKNKPSQPSLAELQREAYRCFRDTLIRGHNEFHLRHIEKTVEAFRKTGVNIFCINGFDELHQLITGRSYGCYVLQSGQHFDIWIDFASCADLAHQLDVPLRAALETSLLHEAAHIHVAGTVGFGKPQDDTERSLAEALAWGAAEQFHNSIGCCSKFDFDLIRRHCLNTYF